MPHPEPSQNPFVRTHHGGNHFDAASEETLYPLTNPLSGALRLCGKVTGLDPHGNVCVVSVSRPLESNLIVACFCSGFCGSITSCFAGVFGSSVSKYRKIRTSGGYEVSWAVKQFDGFESDSRSSCSRCRMRLLVVTQAGT